MKRFVYTAYLDHADAIINVCKLKSHGMMGMSAAVRLSARCLPERRFPDKAIDILDEAAARKRLSAKDGPPPELDGHDIAETVAVKTGMPAAGSGACAFSGLEARLSSEIFGQDGVIAEICPVIRRGIPPL
ncbi:MAG: hypothetical protein BHW37_05315 [Firmicutes bacterium CAG:272_52_7]|nr:MAG: hypothetical protein BHW37_05315 [Firmicutes bacterium CAG:272_52_7]